MSYATRNENGDNMGNTFVRCPVQDKKKFASNWDRIFGLPRTKPGPQVSEKRPDGSIVTTFDRISPWRWDKDHPDFRSR